MQVKTMEKQILRKELSRKIVKNKETVVYEYYRKRNLINTYELDMINDIHGDDAEVAYDYGLAFDWEGDLLWIDVDKFLSWAVNWLLDQEKDEKEAGFEKSVHYSRVKGLAKDNAEKRHAEELLNGRQVTLKCKRGKMI
jgi:hypothetical protein